MRSKKQNRDHYIGSTDSMKTAVDFCPNGCVNLHFDAAVIHMPEADFLVFEQLLSQVAADLRQDAVVALIKSSEVPGFH